MAISDYIPFLPKPTPRFVNERGEAIHGVMAQFDRTPDAYHAAEKVRDAGFQRWDLYSPFPIHGIEEAMGQKRTILPFVVAGGAIAGVATALGMQFWITAVDYPLTVQGKPFDAWEPFTMVTFELGVLFSAFSALLGMLALNGLPRWHHPLMRKDRFLDATDDKFFVVIEATDPKFDPQLTSRMLRDLGASAVELVEDA